MKQSWFYLSLLVGVFAGMLPVAQAADEASTTQTEKKAKKSKKAKKEKGEEAERPVGAMGEKLSALSYFTEAKPAANATHYFFLESASWCGPCKAVMPKIVEQYPEMKKAGVEIILIANEAEDAAKKYLEGYQAEFAGILPTQLNGVPGIVRGQGIPFCCLVDAEGNTVTSGHGRMILQWRQLTNQPASAGPGSANKTIEEMKFLNAKPNKKANYFIYLHSSSTCSACKSIVPSLVKEYKKMKKANVEMILVSHDSTEEAAKAYVKENRIKFPAILDSDPAAKTLPGYTPVSGIPSATIVDKHGTVIKSGHGAIVTEWKTFCI